MFILSSHNLHSVASKIWTGYLRMKFAGFDRPKVCEKKILCLYSPMCKEAGFKPKSSHCLRVTCVSALFNAGVEEKLNRYCTGHRSNALFKYKKVSEMKSTEVSDILAPKCSPTRNVFFE